MDAAPQAGVLPDEAPVAAFLHRVAAVTPGVRGVHVCIHGVVYPGGAGLEDAGNCFQAGKGNPADLAGIPGTELIPLATARRFHGFLGLNFGDPQAFAPFRGYLKKLAGAIAESLDGREASLPVAAVQAAADEFAAGGAGEFCERNGCAVLEAGGPQCADGGRGGQPVPASGAPASEDDCGACALAATCTSALAHKRTEEELLLSELRYRTLVTASSDIVWVTDAQGQVVEPSPRWMAFTGQSFEEVKGAGWLSAVHPDDRERVIGIWTQSVGSQRPYEAEYRLRHRDGEYRYLNVRAAPIREDNDVVRGWIGYCTDITERKKAEQRSILMNFALNKVHEAVFLADENANFLYVNEEACRILGYPREELLRLGVAGIDPDYPAEHYAQHWIELKAKGALTFETRHRTRDGDIFPVELNANYFEFEGRGYDLAMARDITQRKHAEEALKLKADQYATMLSASTDAYWLVDRDLNILDVNDAATQLTGYSRDEMLKLHIRDLAGDHPQSAAHVEETIRNGYCRYETQLRRKDGEQRQLEVSVAFWRATGQFMAFSRDITERRKVEEATRLQADQYATILAASPDGFWLADADGRIAAVNDAACRMSGYSREGMLKLYIWDIEAVETKEQILEHMKNLPQEGFVQVEHKHRRKDGSLFEVELSIAYWKTTSQAIIFSRDITERRRGEKALRESEAKLREAQKIAEVGSWDWDLASGVVSWSAEEDQLLGRDADGPPPTFREFLSYVHPDDRKRLQAGIGEVRRTGAPFQMEYRIMRPCGEVRTVDARMAGFPGEDGKTIRITGTTHDITAAKQNEDRLKAASAYARSLIEASLDPLMTINPEGRITDINEATVRVFGAAREEIIGSEFASHFTEPGRVRADYRTVLSAGYVTNYPLSIRDSSGEVSHVLLNASVYRNPKGGTEGVLAVARDITQQKRHEEELAKLQEQMAATVVELRRRERDTAIIDELSETLQSCKTDKEAYPLIAVAAKRLFPWSCGALAVFASGTRELALAARWGEPSLMLANFAIDECWALRRGQLHQLDGPGEGALCQHFESPPAGPYLCLPLTMSMEPLGLLHLSAVSAHPIDENDRRLAVTLGEVVELSLSNLRLREHLRMQAIRDPLTGLFNRQYLAETLPREYQNARRQKVPLSVAILDIDHFKGFNDSFGHDAGDMVLREVSALLQRSVRAADLACRYGGEEFLLVLPDCDLTMACARLEQICLEIKRRPCAFRGQPLPGITMSAGIAELSADMMSEAELVTAADRALLAAKNSGRDRIETFLPDAAGLAQLRHLAGLMSDGGENDEAKPDAAPARNTA